MPRDTSDRLTGRRPLVSAGGVVRREFFASSQQNIDALSFMIAVTNAAPLILFRLVKDVALNTTCAGLPFRYLATKRSSQWIV